METPASRFICRICGLEWDKSAYHERRNCCKICAKYCNRFSQDGNKMRDYRGRVMALISACTRAEIKHRRKKTGGYTHNDLLELQIWKPKEIKERAGQ